MYDSIPHIQIVKEFSPSGFSSLFGQPKSIQFHWSFLSFNEFYDLKFGDDKTTKKSLKYAFSNDFSQYFHLHCSQIGLLRLN